MRDVEGNLVESAPVEKIMAKTKQIPVTYFCEMNISTWFSTVGNVEQA